MSYPLLSSNQIHYHAAGTFLTALSLLIIKTNVLLSDYQPETAYRVGLKTNFRIFNYLYGAPAGVKSNLKATY